MLMRACALFDIRKYIILTRKSFDSFTTLSSRKNIKNKIVRRNILAAINQPVVFQQWPLYHFDDY